ncbi:MAG: isopeptide-forming domain-containing fimbrial protein [Atopobiaceae bacterium]|jgi:fimbrial isopeptide formation D2 family protein/LPXTG-motif cell wall-anchored protein
MSKTRKRVRVLGTAAITAILGVVLAFSTLGTAFAADGGITIKVGDSGAVDTHSLNAYQVFKGDLSGEVGNYKLANIVWGDGVDGDKLLTALKGSSAFGDTNPFATASTAADVAAVLEADSFNNTASNVEAFANLVAANKKGTGSPLTLNDAKDAYSVTGIDNGYWAVIDESTNLASDHMQDVVLQVAGSTTVANAKLESSKSGKQVLDDATDPANVSVSNTGFGDTAAYTIGSKVPFRIYGSVPSDVAKYTEGYTWNLVDTLPSELTFDTDSVKVYVAPVASDGTPDYAQATAAPEGLVTTNATGGLSFSGNKFNTDNATTVAGKFVVITYTATVNSNATAGTAMDNKVKLTHTTDKTDGGKTGDTPDDHAYVYTFKLDSKKVSAADGTTPVKGAGFKVVRQTPGSSPATYEVATITNGKIASWTTLTTFDTSKNEIAAADKDKGTEITSDTDGAFNVEGLDAGTYYMVETTTPSGYNTLSTPIVATINATTGLKSDGTGAEIKTLTLTTSATDKTGDDATTTGTVAQNVGNTPASSLPSTGGMGTALYVTVGAVVMAAAALGFVIRRRKTQE